MARTGREAGAGGGKEPLPIWFFVGLVLGVYGLLVLGAGVVGGPADTALARKFPGDWMAANPCIWWGALMAVAGGVFLAIGLRRPS